VNRASFPVFVARALANARTAGKDETRLGFAVVGDVPGALLPAGATQLIGPDGREASPSAVLDRVGVYAVTTTRGDGDRSALAVNLLSARESDNRPSPAVASEAARGTSSGRSTPSPRVEASALASLLALVALVLCAGEWYLSARRD
jgi:hypothetical protein